MLSECVCIIRHAHIYTNIYCDAGSRLLFKFRSGTHGLNEELGRHRGIGKGK